MFNIIFLHAGPTFDGHSLEHGPLGGTETALIGVARALAVDLQNRVLIFTNTERDEVVDGVEYRRLASLAAWAQDGVADVLISIRQWVPFVLPVKARYRVYFSPDAPDQPFLRRAFDAALTLNGASCVVSLFESRRFLPNVDAIFCVGSWQAGEFVRQLGFPREKIFVTGNGVVLQNFAPKPLSERRHSLVYSSTPFRGLEHLLRLFPQIKKNCPQAQLDVFSSMGVYGVGRADDERLYGALYRQIAAVGAVSHGSVSQKDLAQALCAARVFAYPNTFDETFCIAVLEAQAAGLPIVTSRRVALAERVSDGVDGFLIDGHPGEAGYDANFDAAVTRLLTDDALWERMSAAARVKAASYSYGNVAQKWCEYFAKIDVLARPVAGVDELGLAAQDWEAPHPDKPGKKIRFEKQALAQFLQQAKQAYGF